MKLLFAKPKPSAVFLLLAVLLGGFIRLWPALNADFPINDGGLFYAMTRDLAANGYRLPLVASYNGLNLPFVYPPLPFYFAGAISDLTGWDLLDLFRILPALFCILAIPAFFPLARDLLESDDQVTLAVFAFAFLPPSFDWLIMGGGLTRAPAFLFSILTLHSTYRLYTQQRWQSILWTALFATLAILCHPEAGLHTAAGVLALFLFFGRNRAGLWKSLAVAGLVFALSTPWWATVVTRHGLDPFLAASRTSGHAFDSVFTLFKFNFTGEYGLQTIGALALIGLLWQLAKKQAFLPTWVLLNFFVEPRSAALYLAPCIALLAAIALGGVFRAFPAGKHEIGEFLDRRGVKLAFGVLLAQWLFSATALVLLEGNLTVPAADRQAFEWARENVPAGSRFLILTGNAPMTDPISEWFPALTGLRSLGTLQGHEWASGEDFAVIMEESAAVQACFNQAPACLETWLERNGLTADYIYITQDLPAEGEEVFPSRTPLPAMLADSGRYEPVYETEEVSILRVR